MVSRLGQTRLTELNSWITITESNIHEPYNIQNIGETVAVDIGSLSWALHVRVRLRNFATEGHVHNRDNIENIGDAVTSWIAVA